MGDYIAFIYAFNKHNISKQGLDEWKARRTMP